jgi:ornithine carbamoyltransferase
MVRHFTSQADLTPVEVGQILKMAQEMKPVRSAKDLAAKTLVMFFEKTSTRTRLSFEVGMTQLGGHAIYVDMNSSQLARGESVADTARVVSRYADMVMARVQSHDTVRELASASSVPVINGLSDLEHPCQSMADLLTMLEHKRILQGLRIAFVGDGNNNVTHSLMLAAAQVGAQCAVGSPQEMQPQTSFIQMAREISKSTGGSISVTDNPRDAVREADVVYTDVWVSMGRETQEADHRTLLAPFQVNADLVSLASPDHIFMHCLPAHIGDEVTAGVAYGPNSVIFDQAENRLHVQKALMVFLDSAG